MADQLSVPEAMTPLDTELTIPQGEEESPVEELDGFEAYHYELDEPIETVKVGEGIGYDVVIHDVTHVLVSVQDTESDALTKNMGGPERFSAAHVVASNEKGDIGPTVIEVDGPDAFEDEDGEELDAPSAQEAVDEFAEEYL